MKIRKTNVNKRGTYTYVYYKAANGGKEVIDRIVELKPVEDGITEADIKMLHAMDDS